jgi:hypothetical protein
VPTLCGHDTTAGAASPRSGYSAHRSTTQCCSERDLRFRHCLLSSSWSLCRCSSREHDSPGRCRAACRDFVLTCARRAGARAPARRLLIRHVLPRRGPHPAIRALLQGSRQTGGTARHTMTRVPLWPGRSTFGWMLLVLSIRSEQCRPHVKHPASLTSKAWLCQDS